MITEDYVSFEVAKLLKEKEFNESCWCYYVKSHIDHYFRPVKNSEWTSDKCSAPTFQMALKWLREVHNIFIGINIAYIGENNKLTYLWIPCVIKQGHIDYPTMEEYMADSYKEAAENAIKYCLNNLI